MSAIEFPLAPGLLRNAAFSQVVVASGKRTVYTAGQVSIDETGALIGRGDLTAQATRAMTNVGRALAAAGAQYKHVVKTVTYVVDYRPEHRIIIDIARKPFFANLTHPPASTLVGVTALAMPGWLVEIEAIAVID
ncbi:enamine deaminase RidA (YjgF/YER057c/UK114 family) [Bradyrhizobium sp. USDA 4461]